MIINVSNKSYQLCELCTMWEYPSDSLRDATNREDWEHEISMGECKRCGYLVCDGCLSGINGDCDPGGIYGPGFREEHDIG